MDLRERLKRLNLLGIKMLANKNFFYAMLFLTMITWGGSWVNAKVLMSYTDVFSMSFIRFFITAISMVPIIYYLGYSFKINLKSLIYAILAGATLLGYMYCYFLGTKYGTASLGGAMVTSMIPIVTFLLLALVGVKRVGKRDAFCLALGGVGVLTMLHIWEFDLASIMVIQNLFFLIAPFLWAILTILSSKATNVSPIVFTFYMYVATFAISWIFFVDVSSIEFSNFDGIFWLNALLMIFAASTFGNTIYFLGVEKLGAAEVSSFIFLVPFSAIGLSAMFLGEKIDFYVVAGTILSILAVKMLNNIRFFKIF